MTCLAQLPVDPGPAGFHRRLRRSEGHTVDATGARGKDAAESPVTNQAKARKAIPVPLNSEAPELVSKQRGKRPTHVFTCRRNTIYQVSTRSWYAALQRAGIENFPWHDLRHAWASWHVLNGTPLFALQEMEAGKVPRWCGAMHTSTRAT